MKIIKAAEFESYWSSCSNYAEDAEVSAVVSDIIHSVWSEGDQAVQRFASRFDKSSPEVLEAAPGEIEAAYHHLKKTEPALVSALKLSADHIRRFSEFQKAQLVNFEAEMAPGLIAGQRVIPVQRAGIYAPAGRFPLISSVLMGAIPALVAGVEEVLVVSPPLENGLADPRIMAAARLAGVKRVFAIGGAQAIAALALGTETVPKVDIIAGPGNKYVSAAKRLLFGEVGIDFIAGPTDILIINDGSEQKLDLVAADMLAQAEHDPDARARVLVPSGDLAELIVTALEKRLSTLPTAPIARQSLDAGGLIIIYDSNEEAIKIANTIAPEHLELQVKEPEAWIPALRNYGSLFIGTLAAEALGDYSAGINHTLPTAGSARFSSGLSVRHFLKTLTTLRCSPGWGYDDARLGTEQIALAEGLIAHRESAASRKDLSRLR